ncbi:MAG TPA: hypothetical protein VJR92_09430 [Gemmatimonadaceae bacterium]|nr:hypothetical protein [Gemmatimonadaceae bacterium]
MITLREKDSGANVGSISDDELQFLIDALEEESSGDTDYWIDGPTIDMLEEDGAPVGLVTMLRAALRGRDGIDIVWNKA